MSWLRSGDTAPSDPRILAVQAMPECDGPWFLGEVRGFVWALASASAGFLTDYVLNLGTVYEYAGAGRAERLLTVCERAGLLERVEVGGLPGVRLVQDPDLFHVRSREEVEWDRQRKRDSSDPNLKGPVLLRDGDSCRYCRREVHWTGRVSNRKATLDHLRPGRPGTVDTLVVACLTCNSARQEDADGAWARTHPLLPPPARPLYGPWTRRYLTERGLLDAGRASVGSPGVDPGTADHRASVGSPGVDPGTGASGGPGPVRPRAPRGWGVRARVRTESRTQYGLSTDSAAEGALRSPVSPGRDGTGTGQGGGPGRDGPGTRDGTGTGGAPRPGGRVPDHRAGDGRRKQRRRRR